MIGVGDGGVDGGDGGGVDGRVKTKHRWQGPRR